MRRKKIVSQKSAADIQKHFQNLGSFGEFSTADHGVQSTVLWMQKVRSHFGSRPWPFEIDCGLDSRATPLSDIPGMAVVNDWAMNQVWLASLASASDEGYARSRTRYALQSSSDQIIGAIPIPPKGSENWDPTPEDANWAKAAGLSYSYPNPLARPVFAIGEDYLVCTDHKVTVLREPAQICDGSKLVAIHRAPDCTISAQYFITVHGTAVKTSFFTGVKGLKTSISPIGFVGSKKVFLVNSYGKSVDGKWMDGRRSFPFGMAYTGANW